MVYTENGTYTAVRRRAPHPKLWPSQIGVFFLPRPAVTGVAARCIKIVDKFHLSREYKKITRMDMKNIPQFYTEWILKISYHSTAEI